MTISILLKVAFVMTALIIFGRSSGEHSFFSASLGWSIADELFMESLVEKNIFNTLKVRASYGQVGLDNWGDENNPFHIGRFEYLTSYSLKQ